MITYSDIYDRETIKKVYNTFAIPFIENCDICNGNSSNMGPREYYNSIEKFPYGCIKPPYIENEYKIDISDLVESEFHDFYIETLTDDTEQSSNGKNQNKKILIEYQPFHTMTSPTHLRNRIKFVMETKTSKTPPNDDSLNEYIRNLWQTNKLRVFGF